MKVAEDQVVADESGFQDDEVGFLFTSFIYTGWQCVCRAVQVCVLRNIHSVAFYLKHMLWLSSYKWANASWFQKESFFQDIDVLQKHGIVS